ncbi:LacI family DNA-binding transcriptional regulator [Marinovum sp.]|uniref:LacI family DNA-binding transcriptional regulator n=1 Tax=Marinovum sp. TaxID=2024839 RepID=UPI003A5C7891
MNGQEGASAKTRQHILDVAKRLNYRPNTAARNLRSRKSSVIGVIVPDISNPFFPEIFRGAESIAQSEGYTLTLSNVVESADREAEVLEKLLNQQVDGLIWCSARMEDALLFKALENAGNVVLINRKCPKNLASSVVVDYAMGARIAVRHLLDIGAKRIGIVAGPDWSFGAKERLRGVEAALRKYEIQPLGTMFCDPTIEGGQQAAATLLAETPDLDALICYNDLAAIGASHACKNLGLAVPGDISLIGFDDIAIASLVSPPITSLGVERYELGRAAMNLLLKRIRGDESLNQVTLQPTLRIRESTMAALRGAPGTGV